MYLYTIIVNVGIPITIIIIITQYNYSLVYNIVFIIDTMYFPFILIRYNIPIKYANTKYFLVSRLKNNDFRD